MGIYDQLTELRRQKPFVPFRITVSDGRSFEVSERFKFAFNELMVLIVKEPAGFDTLRHSEIASIDVLEPIH